jgi:hypothetical protein
MINRCFQTALLLFIILTCVFYQNAQAIAGVITIETETSVTVTGDLLEVSVTTRNKGDESAYNVQVHLILFGERKSGPVKAQLDKGKQEKTAFENTISGLKKGRYPLVVLVDFYDANQYPFSAVSCPTFFLKEDANADLICFGKDISIEESGRLGFKIRNPGSEPKAIRARLILPKELSTPTSQADLRIDAGKEETINFDIKNFSALSGASYPVFCSFEYDSKDTHFTAIAKSLVTIRKNENWFSSTKGYWIGAAIILGVILVAVQFKRKRP